MNAPGEQHRSVTGRRARRGWFITLLGLFGMPILLACGLWGYAVWANSVPPFRPDLPPRPSPNGYDQAVALFAQLPPVPPKMRSRWPNGPPDQLRAAVGLARPILDQIRSTFRLEWRSGPWLGAHQPMTALAPSRECARYFAAEGNIALLEGDRHKAIERYMDSMELGAKLPRGGLMLHALVGVALHRIGLVGTERVVQELPAPAIPGALARLRRIRRSWPTLTEILEGERLSTLSELTETSTNFRRQLPIAAVQSAWRQVQVVPGETDWSEIGEAFALWLTPKRNVLDHVDRYYRQIIVESRKPRGQRKSVPVPNDPISQYMMLDMLPTEEALVWWNVRTSLSLLEVALAARMHRLQHGRYPSRLGEISQRWLVTLPLDPWRQPIVCRLQDGEPLIYSIGPDGKDDGGRVAFLHEVNAATRGDIVWGRLFKPRR